METNLKTNLKSIKGVIGKKAKQNPNNIYELRITGEKSEVIYPHSEIPSEILKVENETGKIVSIEILENSQVIDRKDRKPETGTVKEKILTDRIEILENQLDEYKREIIKNTNLGIEIIKLREEIQYYKKYEGKILKMRQQVVCLKDSLENCHSLEDDIIEEMEKILEL